MRRHLVSIFVIVAALGALAYAYFGDRGTVSDLERERRAHLLFPAFRRDELQSLDIAHGTEKTRFEASDDDAGDRVWKMTAPSGDKGDTVAIDRLLGALEFAAYERKVPDGSDSAFGAPRVRGRLSMNKVVYNFELGGDATPPDGAAYFRLYGEGVFVIKKDLVTELMKTADAYRDRSVVPYLSIELARFEVAGKESWTIQRQDDISFTIVSPGKFQGIRASRTGLDNVWSGIAEMRAEAFPSQDEAAHALAAPVLTMTMTPKDAATPHGVLVLGNACASAPDDIVLQRQQPTPLTACVPKGALTGISTPLEDLADKHLFVAIPEEVAEISVENLASGLKIDLARKGEGWHERSPVDRDLAHDENDMAAAFVKSITSSEGEIANPKPPPFSAAFRIKITRGESNVLETVDLFNGQAHRIADDAVLDLPPLAFRRLQPRVSALRAATIWPTSFDGTRVDQLTDDCATTKQVVTRDAAGAFHFQTPAGLSVDSANLITLADAVERARATSWVADADDGAFGTTNGCSVSITTHGDAGDHGGKISFGGDAGADEVFARVNDDPVVFTVSRALFDLAKTLMVDRSTFFLDADMIDSIDLSHAGKSIHFGLRPGDEDASLEAMTAAAAIGAFQADAAMHLGPPKPEEGFGTPSLDVRAHAIGDGGARSLHFVLGARTVRNGQKVIWARADGTDVSFVVRELSVRPLLDAVGNHGP